MRACQYGFSAEIFRTKKNHPKVVQVASCEKSERIGIRGFQLVRIGKQSCVLLVLPTSDRCARFRSLPCTICLEGQVQGPRVTLQGSALHGVRPFWNRVEHGSK